MATNPHSLSIGPLVAMKLSTTVVVAMLSMTVQWSPADSSQVTRSPYKGDTPQDRDIMKTSDFISFSDTKMSTILPKGALLYVPASYRANITSSPQGQLLMWNRFLSRNLGRIHTLSITRHQAAGLTPIEPAKLEAAIKTGRIVVAVIDGNPTSVRKPRTNKDPDEKSTGKK